MKIFKIIRDNIPKIIIATLTTYTYFYIGHPQAVIIVWFLFLRRFVSYVHERRETK